MELHKITSEQQQLLDAPLPAEAVSPHPTKNYLSTIKAIYVTERLNKVFGVGAWRVRSEQVAHENKMVVVKVTFEIPEYGIYYECYGGNDNSDLGDAHKGAVTDALTKIGSWLGIGADVFKGLASKPTSRSASKQVADPIASVQHASPKPKNRITMEMLDNDVQRRCLMDWAYKFWTASGYAQDFDVSARLLKSYDAVPDVVQRFVDEFNKYKIDRLAENGK